VRSESGRSERQRRSDAEHLRRAIEEDLASTINRPPTTGPFPECPYCTMTTHAPYGCPLTWWRDRTPSPRRPAERSSNDPGPSTSGAQSTEPEVHVIEPGDEFAFWSAEKRPTQQQLFHVKGFLDQLPQTISFLVDTGSPVSIMPRKTLEKHGVSFNRKGKGTRLVGFAGKTETASGTLTREVRIGKDKQWLFFSVSENATRPILGLDALRQFRLVLDTVEGTLTNTSGDQVYCHAIETPDLQKEDEGEASTSQGSKNE